MSTLALIADRSTMSGGDLLLGLAVIAVILGALYGAAEIGERRADPRVTDALAVTLSPYQAEAIGGDLTEASEARRCDECDQLNDLTSGPTCSGCTQRGEYLDAQIRSAR